MFLIFQSDLYFCQSYKLEKAEILEFRVRSVQRVQLNQYYFALYYLLLILFVLNTLTDYNAFFINFRNFAFIKIG